MVSWIPFPFFFNISTSLADIPSAHLVFFFVEVDGFVGDVTPDGRLPDADVPPPGADPADAAHLREIFYRMGKSLLNFPLSMR